MNSPQNPYATPDVAADTASTDHVECLRCGYGPIRLGADKQCPNCDASVTAEAYASLLRFASPEWVARLHRGTEFIIGSVIIGLMIGLILERMGLPDVLQELAGMIPTALGLIGFWWFTARDPIARSDESQLSLRRITRAVAVAGAGTDVLWAITAALGELPPPVVVLSFALGVVEIVVAGHYACQLAMRIPRRKLIRQTMIATWGTALGAAMMASCFSMFDLFSDPPRVDLQGAMLLLASVIVLVPFGIWMLIIMYKYQMAFKRAAEQAAAFAATS
jgi:hypothetical protein